MPALPIDTWRMLLRNLRDDQPPTAEGHVAVRSSDGDPEAAKLFAEGRILARPPLPGSRIPRVIVHPVLADDVQRLPERSLPEAAELS